MTEPVVIINFKTYARGTGNEAAELAHICAEFPTWIAVQPTDIGVCASHHPFVLAQHVDGVEFGSHTGSILAEAVKNAGAQGTLLNHSEHRIPFDELALAVERCKEVGLRTVVCAANVEEAKGYESLEPDYIAVEIPELIAGDTSIVESEPEVVQQATKTISTPTLMGAGVHSGADVAKSVEWGAAGVILASAVVKKAADPREALRELFSQL